MPLLNIPFLNQISSHAGNINPNLLGLSAGLLGAGQGGQSLSPQGNQWERASQAFNQFGTLQRRRAFDKRREEIWKAEQAQREAQKRRQAALQQSLKGLYAPGATPTSTVGQGAMLSGPIPQAQSQAGPLANAPNAAAMQGLLGGGQLPPGALNAMAGQALRGQPAPNLVPTVGPSGKPIYTPARQAAGMAIPQKAGGGSVFTKLKSALDQGLITKEQYNNGIKKATTTAQGGRSQRITEGEPLVDKDGNFLGYGFNLPDGTVEMFDPKTNKRGPMPKDAIPSSVSAIRNPPGSVAQKNLGTYTEDISKIDAQLGRLTEYFGTVGGSDQGIKVLSNDILGGINTLLGNPQTAKQLAQDVQRGELAGLTAPLARTVGGGGVLSEGDIARMYTYLGGDLDVWRDPEAVRVALRKVYRDTIRERETKRKVYNRYRNTRIYRDEWPEIEEYVNPFASNTGTGAGAVVPPAGGGNKVLRFDAQGNQIQ